MQPVSHRSLVAWALLLSGLTGWHDTKPLLASTNAITRYSVRIWQTDDGLPQNSVFAIAQTKDGYLWVGTHEGLARFDGNRFVLVDEPAAPELKRGWITALCATSDGSLWVAVDGVGLTRLRKGTITRFSEADGLASNQPRCLLQGRDGSLWIGSEGGLTRLKDSKFTNYTVKHGLGGNSIRALCEDRQGVLRIATTRGLSSLTPEGVISNINFGINTIGNALKSVCQDREGNIWVASNEGVTRVSDQLRVAYGTGEGLPDRLATTIYEDAEGRVWVGTYNGVACLVDGKVICTPMNEEGFGDLIYAICEDSEENLWVGGRDGLYRLRPARFTTFSTREEHTGGFGVQQCDVGVGRSCGNALDCHVGRRDKHDCE
jgi:ligand-binding sensor domain-containing protein